METPTRAPAYDFFKLIVAIFLLILALILMWISPPQTSVSFLITPSATPEQRPITSPAAGPASPTSSPLAATPSPTETGLSEPTATSLPSSTSPPSTVTALPASTNISEPTATHLPLPTETPTPEATVTPPAGTSEADVCTVARSRSHLQVGKNATILRRLNFRSSPGIGDNWLRTNVPGTPVKIVGGPECTPYWNGAYLWWHVQLSDGTIGWSAEESMHGSFYFMEPT